MDKIIGLKKLRQNVEEYAARVKKGESLIVVRRSEPIFKLVPVEDAEEWEEVINFSEIKKGGVNIKDILSRI